MKTDTKIRLLFIGLAIAGWLALTAKPAHSQEPPKPEPTVVYVQADNAQDAFGQTIVSKFVADAGASGVQVIPTDPTADAPDATVFHILTSQNLDKVSDTLLFVVLRHVKGSTLQLYVGSYATNVRPGEEQDVTANIEQLAALVVSGIDKDPEFNVTITPKTPPTKAPTTSPSAVKVPKGIRS